MAENFTEKIKELQKHKNILKQIDLNKPKAEHLLKDKEKTERFLKRLEMKLSEIPIAGKYLADIPVFISLVKAYIDKKYTTVPIGTILAVVSALIYLLNVIDVIPDFIPIAGILDDAAVAGLAYKLVRDDITEYKTWRDEKKE